MLSRSSAEFFLAGVCVLILHTLTWSGPGIGAQPAQIAFEHLSVDQGLSQSSGRAILQDSRGFIWVGTEDGLNKYDGIGFQIYRHDPQDSTSISANMILDLYEDRHGAIWVSTINGLNKLDPVKEVFEYYQRKLARPDDEARCFYEDNAGALWIGTNRGLQKLDRNEDRFLEVGVTGVEGRSLAVRFLLEDKSGAFWVVAGETALYSFSRETGHLSRIPVPGETAAGTMELISTLHLDREGVLWLAAHPVGVFRFDPKLDQFRKLKTHSTEGSSFADAFILKIAEDRAGKIWFAAEADGLYVLDRPAQKLTHLSHHPSDPRSLSSNGVISMIVDRAGAVWVGTAGAGLNKFDPQKRKFSQLKDTLREQTELGRVLVWALLQDSAGYLWVGTHSNGLLRIDREKGESLRLQHDPKDARSLSSNTVYALCEDQLGTIWVGTANAGLNALNRRTMTFRRYQADQSDSTALQSNRIRRLYADRQGSLWIGTLGAGLGCLNIHSGHFEHYRHDPADSSSLSNNYVSYILRDRQGTLWVGTEMGGLNRLRLGAEDGAEPFFSHYKHNPDDEASLSNNRIMSICEGTAGVLWVGTSRGLNRLDAESGRFKVYTTKHGLPNDVVYGILTDEQGHLWLSTNKGLSRFDPRTERFKNFDLADGLQSFEFNSGAFFKNESGEMFFGGIRGVNFFHPERVRDNPHVPPVVITSLKRFDQPIDLAGGGPIKMSYKDNFISFQFVALSYTNPQKNQYAYKLEGFNERWIAAGNQRFATFTNLDPGDYTFRVKGANSDGVWNEKGAALQIRILPPFWQTWWFRVLGTLLGICLLALVILNQRNKLKKKAALDRRISELKLQALRAQMNPHFVFNTINSIQYFISSNEKKAAFQYLSKFSKLMRKMLENAEKSSLPVSEELDSLKLYLDLELLRFEGKFEYELNIDSGIDLENQRIPTMLIQPFVENAIHHGLKFKRSKGVLRIDLRQRNGTIVCTIEDNGIGIEKALELKNRSPDQHKPTGMKVTQERLRTLNALKKNGKGVEIIDLGLHNDSGHGTKVKIVIPLETSDGE